MAWIKREHSPRHTHRMPTLWPWVHEGSEWSCDTCYRVYHVHLVPDGIGFSKQWENGYRRYCGCRP